MLFTALKIIDYGLEYYAVGLVLPNMGKSRMFSAERVLLIAEEMASPTGVEPVFSP